MKQQTSKWRSYTFWLSVGSAVMLVLQSFARAYGFAFDEEIINDIITSICGVLVVLGVFIMPSGTTLKLDNLGVVSEELEDSSDEKSESTTDDSTNKGDNEENLE